MFQRKSKGAGFAEIDEGGRLSTFCIKMHTVNLETC